MGEAKFGLLDGVIATTPGFLEGAEVVEVEFDAQVISYEKLVRAAVAAECAIPVFTRSDAQQEIAGKLVGEKARRNDQKIKVDNDLKYYLAQTALKHLPMTSLQAARINALLKDPRHRTYLAPSQRVWLDFIEDHPEAEWKKLIGIDLVDAWKMLEEQKRKIDSE